MNWSDALSVTMTLYRLLLVSCETENVWESVAVGCINSVQLQELISGAYICSDLDMANDHNNSCNSVPITTSKYMCLSLSKPASNLVAISSLGLSSEGFWQPLGSI